MTAHSTSNGHPISFINNKWVFDDMGTEIKKDRDCLLCGEKQKSIILKNGKSIKVDSCISNIIKILNDNGMETHSSCCGHGKTGFIIFNNGLHFPLCSQNSDNLRRTPHFDNKSAGKHGEIE